MRYGGFVNTHHDASISILDEEGNIEGIYSAERYARIKHYKVLPVEIMDMLLKCDERIFHEDIFAYYDEHKDLMYEPNIDVLTNYSDHHTSHAAAAFYTRPWESYEDTVVLTIDGFGNDYLVNHNVFVYNGESNKLECKYYERTAIGKLYSTWTRVIAKTYRDLLIKEKHMGPNKLETIGGRAEGQVMGLSSFGEPKYCDMIEESYISSQLDLVKKYSTDIKDREKYFCRKKSGEEFLLFRGMSMNLRELFDKFEKEKNFYKPEDIAASLQKYTEKLVLELATIARKYGSKLCFSGGVANNILLNSKLTELFDDVWVVPDPSDGGNSLGAAAAAWGQEQKKSRINFSDAYLGYDIKREVNPKEVVDYILKHKVCGIANGRAEFGPRALGNRSLIGDVRYDIKDTVNAIKKRQPWRPFGPVILEEEFDNWFDGPTNGYMQFVCKPKHDMKSVIHVDGTSRVQTVPSNSKSIIRPILEEYFERTGIPMLLNTSLNIKGQPMVNDEDHAEDFERRYNVRVF